MAAQYFRILHESDFGAEPDAKVIQDAIDGVTPTGGFVVLPPRTYQLSESIRIERPDTADRTVGVALVGASPSLGSRQQTVFDFGGSGFAIDLVHTDSCLIYGIQVRAAREPMPLLGQPGPAGGIRIACGRFNRIVHCSFSGFKGMGPKPPAALAVARFGIFLEGEYPSRPSGAYHNVIDHCVSQDNDVLLQIGRNNTSHPNHNTIRDSLFNGRCINPVVVHGTSNHFVHNCIEPDFAMGSRHITVDVLGSHNRFDADRIEFAPDVTATAFCFDHDSTDPAGSGNPTGNVAMLPVIVHGTPALLTERAGVNLARNLVVTVDRLASLLASMVPPEGYPL